jgi:parvulin-like peptidyl-prolyl isomerase
VGDAVITRADFDREAERLAAVGRLPEDAGQLLRGMTERLAMLQMAKAASADDPETQREVDNLLLVRWRDKQRGAHRAEYAATDEDLRDAYEADPAAWARPAQVRLAMLYRKVPRSATPEARAEIENALLKAVETYKSDADSATDKGRMQGFGSLAVDNTEDQISRYRGGDLGWMEAKASSNRVPAEVLKTGMALKKGEISELIAAEGGVYVIMKTDEREETRVPYEEAAVALRRRIMKDKSEAADRAMIQRAVADVGVTIADERLESLSLPAPLPAQRTPSAPPSMPSVGTTE